MVSMSSAVVVDGRSISWMHAPATSRRLWGGMSVAMPTAIPVEPFKRTIGNRAGNSSGSDNTPSKLGT